MRLSDFDFALPEGLVAQAPVTPRDASRLMVLAPGEGAPAHRGFADLPELLAPGDLLVFNDTRVIPARLLGHKASGGKVELLLCEPLEGGLGRRWRAMGQASKPIREGAVLTFDGLEARVDGVEGEGFYRVTLDRQGPELEAALGRAGRIPLPPYIRRAPDAEDAARYQTIWARAPGSAAAPTAGLHFTEPLLARLAARGIRRTAVTLHVGPGTFLPIRGDDLDLHRMHGERYEVSPAAAEELAATRARGGRIVAVGTTSVRTLESAWRDGAVAAGPGRTELFIRPGHPFHAVDAMVTNFHLPRSTLLVLVCAFGGQGRVLAAYREAVARGYRFFSYGDAMLVLRR
ncbi:S-adenosylmethionine/tRNA-ribosyltransferase-isomerase [Anaeromyxobacter sp. K]|uniref:S-adenosylmethionine:tRNA ribosyltransferase-isomerase n=1 Tax=Anaeromyxobacter sp. (strain K) TaxID=447217 RepID=QUEA_ANASK|nr:tRNA preQ1(34) S-adenosylmethionine ribosyltransferase-isomerase QueA [Anaeromyxobacter sp. K]B4UID2.1 RecName: Full=S-adenosylmethionine:tRNA ribosyltransferase-isomerase; AltName: Full=Queuosine biosynthesis protein QueA [Anaeromyxobacter sp. K]ACG72537.1 S-adenosylmethionine/tRNA-ribosyltransferase-isomerase [Anaeromyxobacter sp. K]